ncbi:flagellar export protein FliJ [Frondihabitans cladoniiphilus]|uniref:Flagellar FliJ protein n=1 Tax=Frondihabitans cladoniiphilus TaxID=715785 RepID=A0ABP8VYE4_9MICO
MASPFSLSGLLRVRHAQQKQAMAELAAANNRVGEIAERRASVEHTLEGAVGNKSVVTDAATLNAIAAARASTRGMLTELDAIAAQHRASADLAQAEFNAARARSIALEKLETRHAEAAAAEDLRVEQIALDEIASIAHTRGSASPPAVAPAASSSGSPAVPPSGSPAVSPSGSPA